MRYLIDFSYDGSGFNGYQKQKNKRTVQEDIEKVLTNINNAEVTICSSGRTDKGVNALHQKANGDLNKKIACYKLKGALNSYWPDDIYINDVSFVDDNFHARYMVKSKTYEYKISTNAYNPIQRTHVFQYGKKLNIRKMKKAIKYFKGTHDFTTFASAEDKRENKTRTIDKVYINNNKGIITIGFVSKGFLKYQVRNMVGVLIKVGEEKIKPEKVKDLFIKKDRRCAYLCAPAEGLTLKTVEY